MTVRPTLLQSNRSQAVRLPKDMAFPAPVCGVAILCAAARRHIVPADSVWDDFFAPRIAFSDRRRQSIGRAKSQGGRSSHGSIELPIFGRSSCFPNDCIRI